MNIRQTALATLFPVLAAATFVSPASAQDKPSAPAEVKAPAGDQPTGEDMAKMMALTQPGENHKVLAQLAGSWTYKLKFWMAPGMPPSESSGTTDCKAVMDGRYFLTNTGGKFQMPGADGQMHDVDFKGMAVDGYDNLKQKFVSSWIDNMGTSILMSEGTYDPSSKTFTYRTEEEQTPGVKTKVRESIKILDENHHVLEWYQEQGGQEVKVMEISYTRQG